MKNVIRVAVIAGHVKQPSRLVLGMHSPKSLPEIRAKLCIKVFLRQVNEPVGERAISPTAFQGKGCEKILREKQIFFRYLNVFKVYAYVHMKSILF